MSAASVPFLFLVTFRAIRHYILNYLAKKEAVQNSVYLGLDREIGTQMCGCTKQGLKVIPWLSLSCTSKT